MFPTSIIVSSAAAAAVVLGSHYIVDAYPMTRAAVRASSVDRAIDPALALQVTRHVVLVGSQGAGAAQKNPTCSPNPIPVATTPRVYRALHKVSPPTRIVYVRPEYPEDARVKKVQGILPIEVQIERDGHVCSARVLRSIPLLDQSAIDAVLRWRFLPATVNDVAVPVTMTLTINFTLPQ